MRSNFSKRVLLFLGIFTLSSAITFGIGYLIFSSSRERIIQHFGQSSLALASSIATFIENDIDPYRQLTEEDDYSSGSYDQDYYSGMLSVFQTLKGDANATYLYTMKKISEDEFIYILDGETPSSDGFSAIGSVEASWDELNDAFAGISSYSKLEYDLVWDETMMTALAPIIDPDSGSVIGVVGVDLAAERIEPLVEQIRNTLFIGMSLFVIVLSIVVFLLFESRLEALELDYLTGLFSKRYFDKRLGLGIIDAKLKGIPLTMMMLDVDSFKAINDRFGHQTGDQVLKDIADLIKKSIRRSDVCARYGGDEFAFLMPDAGLEEAQAVTGRIIGNLERFVCRPDETNAIALSVSIGICLWNKNLTREALTDRSDRAMYHSKAQGNNRVSLFLDDGTITIL